MALIRLNSYKGTFADSSEEVVDVASMEEAVDYMTTLRQEEPRVVEKIRSGIAAITTTIVDFVTSINLADAVTAGAVATPSAFSVVDGTHVIFEATVPTGFNFLGWWRDGALISLQPIVDIQVLADNTGGTVTYEAHYEVTP